MDLAEGSKPLARVSRVDSALELTAKKERSSLMSQSTNGSLTKVSLLDVIDGIFLDRPNVTISYPLLLIPVMFWGRVEGRGMHVMTPTIVTFGLCTHRDPVVLSSSCLGDFLFLLAAAQMTMLLKRRRQRCFV